MSEETFSNVVTEPFDVLSCLGFVLIPTTSSSTGARGPATRGGGDDRELIPDRSSRPKTQHTPPTIVVLILTRPLSAAATRPQPLVTLGGADDREIQPDRSGEPEEDLSAA